MTRKTSYMTQQLVQALEVTEVDDNGEVWYEPNGIWLDWEYKETSNRPYVNVPEIGKIQVCRLVAIHKYGEAYLEKDMVIRHHPDPDVNNNTWDNLIIGTRKDNFYDMPEWLRDIISERLKNTAIVTNRTLGPKGRKLRTKKAVATMKKVYGDDYFSKIAKLGVASQRKNFSDTDRQVIARKQAMSRGFAPPSVLDIIRMDQLVVEKMHPKHIAQDMGCSLRTVQRITERRRGWQHLPHPPLDVNYPSNYVYPLTSIEQQQAEEYGR